MPLLNDDYYRDWYYSLFDKTKLFWLFNDQTKGTNQWFLFRCCCCFLGPQVNPSEFSEICIKFYFAHVKALQAINCGKCGPFQKIAYWSVWTFKNANRSELKLPITVEKFMQKSMRNSDFDGKAKPKKLFDIQNAIATTASNPAETGGWQQQCKRSYSCVRSEKFSTPIMSSSGIKWKIWAECGVRGGEERIRG